MPDLTQHVSGSSRRSVESRIGTTFVLLIQVRVLVVGVTVLIDRQVRGDFWALSALAAVALFSGLMLLGWEQVVSRLYAQPALLACDVLLGFAVLKTGGIIGPYFLVTVIAAGLAGLLYRWPTTLVLCLQQTVLYYVALLDGDGTGGIRGGDTLPLLLAMPAFYGIGALVGSVIRRLFDEQAAAEEALWRSEAMAMAAEERSHLARELHDSLTGTLSGIALTATSLPMVVRKSPDRAVKESQRIAAAAQIATRQARSLIADLRADAVQRPLDVVVRELVAEWGEATGVRVTDRVQDGADLPLHPRHEAVAIVKEALENVRRHAGATAVEVAATDGPDGLRVVVRDDGRGLPERPGRDGWLDALADGGHYGLLGMHERARRAGGELTVDSTPGGGTRVTVRFRHAPSPEDASGSDAVVAAGGDGTASVDRRSL
ncbi:histidine kinase [Actinomadura madurae]|uniref:sensor histidine kinase n=1 Tax=Actinomadura madurae TaxID=1993 RepID=UPI002026FD56|nr:ATP-binding protein [Actinomadura madurae]URM96140.1 histidine kinase [Actinomadura madurae]URN06844.1 histidine kinase [Actinomadura madurae]